MPIDPQDQARLINWLEDQGHAPNEIDAIMAKVAQYDARTLHESLFDAIDRGEFDLESIIDEVLRDRPAGDEPAV
jgi:hypothetical protein